MKRTYPQPAWAGSSYEKWAQAWTRKNLWRVEAVIGDFEDGLQECAIVYHRCVRLYPHINKQNWLMAMFQRSVKNRWNDLSLKAGRRVRTESLDEAASDTQGDAVFVALHHVNPALIAESAALVLAEIAKRPDLQALLVFLVDVDDRLLKAILACSDTEGRTRRLARFAGVPTAAVRDLCATLGISAP